MRDFGLRLEWLAGRLRGALGKALHVDLGGHSEPWWRWRTYRLFYDGSRKRKGRDRTEGERSEA